ncbi:MAG: fibronectin type III domain-containing protein [Candidatus Sericytochromatia bacterium]|nr:fibronectin type III domain-containing protein [Candidatus Sericytochromatia bacterium]
MKSVEAPPVNRRPRRRKRSRFKLLRRMLGLFALTCTLVGCSFIASRVTTKQPLPVKNLQVVHPGPGSVTIETRTNHSARITWYSPWRGTSTITWGRKPSLDEPIHFQAVKNQSAYLTRLTPGMRYYFRIETETSVGVARSPVVSFIAK